MENEINALGIAVYILTLDFEQIGGLSHKQAPCVSMDKSLHTDEPRNGETHKEKRYKMENTIEMQVKANTKNLSKLPKADCVSIHVDGNSGKVKDGTLKASAFIIMVKCNGEWRPENEWLHKAGMKTARRVYTDIEKAKAAKAEIKAKWGVPTSKTGKAKDEAVAKAKAEVVENMRQAMLGMGMKPEMVEILMANLNK